MGDWEYEYDKFVTNPPEPKESKFKCWCCGRPFSEGDRVYQIEGESLCEVCAIEWFDEQYRFADYDECYG